MTLLQAKKKPRKGLIHTQENDLNRQHADLFSLFTEALVTPPPVDLGEDGIIPSHPNVTAWVDARAKLAYQDIARAHTLSAEDLDPPSLTSTVSPVAGTPARLFMSLTLTPSSIPRSP